MFFLKSKILKDKTVIIKNNTIICPFFLNKNINKNTIKYTINKQTIPKRYWVNFILAKIGSIFKPDMYKTTLQKVKCWSME